MSNIALWTALVAALFSLHGAAGSTRTVTYDSIARQVRSENPDLAAARLRLREAEGRWRQAGVRPNPELETEVEHDPKFREWRAEFGVSLLFPLSDRLVREKAVSHALLKAAEEELREREHSLAMAGREAVIEILALRERREGLNRQRTVARELATYLSGLAEKGEGSSLEAGQAGIEAAALEADELRLKAREAEAAGRLKVLLGCGPEERLQVEGALPLPEAAGAASSEPVERAVVKAKRLEAQAAREAVAMEEGRSRGDLNAGVFFAGERAEDAPDGSDEEWITGFRLRIPLPLIDRNEGSIAAARAARERMELETVALSARIQNEAATARAEMERWAALVAEMDQTLLPAAREQGRLTENAYRAGQVDLQPVLRLREKELQLSAARLDAVREFHLARVRHDAAVGQP
jgi:cobalt-zinc-cadmium efflux system outer membrane protein